MEGSDEMLYRVLRMLFRIILMCFGRWKITGIENLPAYGPIIVVCNHVSYWDPVLVGCALSRPVHFMAKAELFSIPVFGNILKKLGAFPIKRGQSDRSALRTAINLLRQGKVIGVFPEGTRSTTSNLLPFKTGITMIAYKAGCPILPMGVINSKKVLLGWFYPVEIRIGKPMELSVIDRRPSAEELEEYTEDCHHAVELLLKNVS